MENHQLDVDVWLLHSNTKPAMSICAVCAHCFRNRQQQYNDDDCRDEDDEDTIPLNELPTPTRIAQQLNGVVTVAGDKKKRPNRAITFTTH